MASASQVISGGTGARPAGPRRREEAAGELSQTRKGQWAGGE